MSQVQYHPRPEMIEAAASYLEMRLPDPRPQLAVRQPSGRHHRRRPRHPRRHRDHADQRRYRAALAGQGQAARNRMRRAASRWISSHGMLFSVIRCDVIGLAREDTGSFTIEHIRGVAR